MSTLVLLQQPIQKLQGELACQKKCEIIMVVERVCPVPSGSILRERCLMIEYFNGLNNYSQLLFVVSTLINLAVIILGLTPNKIL